MPIDSNIYSQQQTPDILGGVERGLKLRDMMDQRSMNQQKMSDDKALRDAYNTNMSIGPNGQVSVNKGAFLAQLAGTGHAQEAAQQSIALQQQDAANLKAQAEVHQGHLNAARDAFASVTPETYPTVLKSLIANGHLNPGDMPEQYDPNVLIRVNKMIQSADQALNYHMQEDKFDHEKTKDAAELDLRKQEAENKKHELAMEFFKTFGYLPPGLSASIPGGQPSAVSGKRPVQGGPGGDQGGQGQLQDSDPAELVRFHVPPAQQQKAFDEIKAAQNTAKNSREILQAFDDSANKWHAADLNPLTQSGDQMKFHALLGPTFQDVEGTVRQAAMDNAFKNMTPAFGDSKEKLAKKREALIGYMTSKSAAPTNKGFGIDLSRYKSTITNPDAKTGFDPDVLAYAQKHSITPEAAAQIKADRTGQKTAGQ